MTSLLNTLKRQKQNKRWTQLRKELMLIKVLQKNN